MKPITYTILLVLRMALAATAMWLAVAGVLVVCKGSQL